tara:strand:+ start:444 stop:710 length:267 start_codon:yes stop_codon:yes gene_type:complete
MIIQLPNGRIIECSVELYLTMSDDDIKELYGLGSMYTKEVSDPFYNQFHKAGKVAKEDMEEDQEYEPELDQIDVIDKLEEGFSYKDDV